MYHLDYKINNSLAKVRDIIAPEFIIWLEEKGSKPLTTHKKELATNVVGCFVGNVAYRVQFGKTDISIPRKECIYSQPLIYNATKVGRSVSYTYTMKFCKFLLDKCECGIIEGSVTFELDREDYAKQIPVNGKKKAKFLVKDKQTTQYILSEELLGLFSGSVFRPEETVKSVIEVRDANGKPISKRLTPKQKHMMSVLMQLNIKYKTNLVCIDGERMDFQLKKIYNNSAFYLGGRNYMLGEDANKVMGKATRLKITINSEPCVELDFKSLFPSMIADMAGITFPPDFDPYAVEIEGCDSELLRDVAKKGCLMLLNTDNMKAAQCALASAMAEDEWKERIDSAKKQGKWKDGRVLHEVIEKLIERNGYLMHECNSNNSLKYMNYESEINDIVLESILMDGGIAIPLHDSFIVPVSWEDQTKYHMERAYSLVIGGNNCRITSKVAEA